MYRSVSRPGGVVDQPTSKLAIGSQRMCSGGERYAIAALKQLALIYRQFQVDRADQQAAFEPHFDGKGMSEIRVLEQLTHHPHMIGKIQVVIRQVTDDAAACLMQRLVPISLAIARALGVIEEPDGRAGPSDAIADDEDFHGAGLPQRASDTGAEGGATIVRGDNDSR